MRSIETKSPYLTVMLPVYNGQDYLAQAIESVLSQPCEDLEVLVLDDGSKDNTKKIAQKYVRQDPRVRLLSHENVGLGQNRNLGYAYVRGEWLVFLDHDDVMFPGIYTEALLNSLTKCKESGIEMVVNSRVRGNEQLSDLYFDRIKTNGLFPSGSQESWNIPFELATNLYSSDLIMRNNILFSTTRPEMESIFRHKCAYLANRVMFCNQGFIEIRRMSDSQITKTWNKLQMRAVRLAEYAKLPQWHSQHGNDADAVNQAYRILSGTIVEFFDDAVRSGTSVEDIQGLLYDNEVDKEILIPNDNYTISANSMIRLYHNKYFLLMKVFATIRGLIRLSRRGFVASFHINRNIVRVTCAQLAAVSRNYPTAIRRILAHAEKEKRNLN
jgi:glycosyltransferase involved in cell wall biosynthesis